MSSDHHPFDDPDWLPDEAIKALNVERRTLYANETPAQTARRLMHENSPGAALSIVQIALYGSNERLRLDAAKYVVDRALGRPGEDLGQGEDSPLDAMMKKMAAAAEAHANQGK